MEELLHLALSPWVQKLGGALLHSLWQGLAIAALLLLVLRLLRQYSANARYLAACGALLALGVCPVATLLALTNASDPQSAAAQTVSLQQRAAGEAIQAPAFAAAKSSALSRRSSSPLSLLAFSSTPAWCPIWLLPALVVFWLLGVLCLSLRLFGNWLHVQWLTHAFVHPVGQPLQQQAERLARRMGLTRPVRVLLSSRISMPVMVGWLQASILFPASTLIGLSPRQLEAILAHELAHVRRHDYLVNALQMLLETLLFYHPATWWISEQIRKERENCCDDIAVQVCGDRLIYAHALAALEDLQHSPISLAMAADGDHLLSRIRRILGKPSRTRFSPLNMGGSALLYLVSLTFLAWLTPALVHAKGSTALSAPQTGAANPTAPPPPLTSQPGAGSSAGPQPVPPITSGASTDSAQSQPGAPKAPSASIAGVVNPRESSASQPAASSSAALAGPSSSRRKRRQRRSAPQTGAANPTTAKATATKATHAVSAHTTANPTAPPPLTSQPGTLPPAAPQTSTSSQAASPVSPLSQPGAQRASSAPQTGAANPTAPPPPLTSQPGAGSSAGPQPVPPTTSSASTGSASALQEGAAGPTTPSIGATPAPDKSSFVPFESAGPAAENSARRSKETATRGELTAYRERAYYIAVTQGEPEKPRDVRGFVPGNSGNLKLPQVHTLIHAGYLTLQQARDRIRDDRSRQ